MFRAMFATVATLVCVCFFERGCQGDDMHHSSELGTVASVVLMTALFQRVSDSARTPDASIADARISAIVQRVLDQHPI